MVEVPRLHHEARLRIPHHQVGIGSRRDPPLPAVQAGQPGRRGAHPPGQVGDREAALPRAGPHRGQGELQRGDPAPGAAEVSGLDLLQIGRAGRVVGRDQVEDSLAEGLPEPFPVLRRADRRSALEGDAAVGDLAGGERQIVGAGLGRDQEPFLASPPQDRQDLCRRDVNDMNAAARLAAEPDQKLHGLDLRRVGPGPQVAAVLAERGRTRSFPDAGRRVDRPRQLGVREEHGAVPGKHRQGLPQIGLANVLELVDSRGDQERLEAKDAVVQQPRELPGIAGHHAAPEADVDVRLLLGRLQLGLEGLPCGRGGDAVERHVHQRGDASRGRGAGRGRKSLPAGPPRLVDVDVGVDQAGEDDEVSAIQQSIRCLVPGAEAFDLPLADVDGGGTCAVDGHDAAAAEDEAALHAAYSLPD